MVYNTRDYWFFWIFPSSGVLETKKSVTFNTELTGNIQAKILAPPGYFFMRGFSHKICLQIYVQTLLNKFLRLTSFVFRTE
jgi:hypothetical protein